MKAKNFYKYFDQNILILSKPLGLNHLFLIFLVSYLFHSFVNASDCKKLLLLPFLSSTEVSTSKDLTTPTHQSTQSFSQLAEQISQGLLLTDEEWEIFSSYIVFHFQDSKKDAPEDISPHAWENLFVLATEKSQWIRPPHKEFIITGPSSYFYNYYPLSIQSEQTLRIRPLTAQEIPYREYLGPTPIQLRYNPYTFIDPRFIFFTLTTKNHTSHGIVTLVLGESQVTENNLLVKKNTALLLSIEEIPNELITTVIEGIRQSLELSGYSLAIPNPNGSYIFSENSEAQRSIKLKVVSPSIKSGNFFQIHPDTQFNNYNLNSNSFIFTDIKYISHLQIESDLTLSSGNIYEAQFNNFLFDLDILNQTAQYSPEDPPEKIKDFITYSTHFEKMEFFLVSSFEQINDYLYLIIQNYQLSNELRVLAFLSLTLNEPDSFLYNLNNIEPRLQKIILDEIETWTHANDAVKQNFIYILSQIFPNQLKSDPSLKEVIKKIIKLRIIRPDLYIANKNKRPVFLIHYYIKFLPFDILTYLVQFYKDWSPPLDPSNHSSSDIFSLVNNQGDSAWIKILLLMAEKAKFEDPIVPLNFIYVEQRNQEGNQILHLAALHGATELIQWLSEVFPNISLNQVNFHRKTPLQIAIESAHFDTAELLSFKLTNQILNKVK